MRQFVFLLLCTLALRAQDVSVTASVDSQSVVIGDWIRYTVEVRHPSSVSVAMPVFRDTMGLFDIVRQDTVVRSEQAGQVQLTKQFVIARYEPGSVYVQPFMVSAVGPDGDTVTASSNPIPVEIRGVEVDTSMTIKDVKPPMTVPISAEEIALYTGIVAALGGLAYALYYYIRKRRSAPGAVQEEQRPNIPPHVLALMQLEALEAKRLWQAGEVKAYYSEATEIVRRYFEQRYGIMALEMTTGEVMAQLSSHAIPAEDVSRIQALLSGADMVKFAKYQPVAAENEQVIAEARLIVERTMPRTAAAAEGAAVS
ncbi:MAG: hypothetical protein HUU02_11355 [Bacteroidetes bacterium]|nr:hypothetical protein [Bacteroidota bacterium]